jgi:hypothetical protein
MPFMKPRENGEFEIWRFYASNKKPELIKSGLTWLKAQEHASNLETRKEGKWFDGFKQVK